MSKSTIESPLLHIPDWRSKRRIPIPIVRRFISCKQYTANNVPFSVRSMLYTGHKANEHLSILVNSEAAEEIAALLRPKDPVKEGISHA